MSKVEIIEIKIPAWVRKDKMEDKLLNPFRAEILAKVEYYRSQTEIFNDKYKMGFIELKQKIEADNEENFALEGNSIEY